MKEKIVICLIAGVLALPGWGFAQEKVEVTPTFRFEDGVYLSYADFQRNEPTFSWEEVEAEMVINPQTLIGQVEDIRPKNTSDSLDLEEIWGFSRDGLPYVRIPQDSIDKPLTSFAGIRLAGKICYYSYENRVEKEYEFAAYNPLNGRPFRKATVSRSETVFVEKVFRFAEGTSRTFSRQTLEQWMSDDPQLLQVLTGLDQQDKEYAEKLFRLLMSYNRRHPVFFLN